MEKAIFVDRDGTIIEEVNYLSNLKDLKIYRFSYDAMEVFHNLGFKVIVITNQSGIGRGYFPEEFVNHIHDILKRELYITDFFFCPHKPEDNCNCRKPKTGLIEKALKKYNIDLEKSYFIGDSSKDIDTAINAGLKHIQVLTGYGKIDINPESFQSLNLYTAALMIKNLEEI